MGYSKYLGDDKSTVQLYGDNTEAIALAKNPRLHERSKQFDVVYHYTREQVEKGRMTVTYIPTLDMIADGFTKPLARPAFERFRDQLGLVETTRK